MAELMTPRTRKRLAETRDKPYVPFNPKPKDVGTNTGLPMPKNVPKTADGFEDPDIFFKSPTSTRGRNMSMGGMTTPGTATTSRTRGRMSNLTVEDPDDEEMAESLLGDDGDLLGDQLSTPARGSKPFFSGSNPPPSVTLPRRSQLPPPSPNVGFDAIPSPQRTAKKGSNKTPNASQRLADALNIDEPIQEADDTVDDLSPTQLNSDDDDDDDVAGVEMGRNRLSMASRKSIRTPTKAADLDPDADTDEEMASDIGGTSLRIEDDNLDFGGDDNTNLGGDDYDDDGGDVGLEQEAVDQVNAYPDPDEEEEEEEEGEEEVEEIQVAKTQVVKKRKGKERERSLSKQPRAAAKPKRKSLHHQLPLNEQPENAITGDFTVRRTGRQHFAPLEYWRGERFVYEKGQVVPLIKDVVRKPDDFVEPLSGKNKRRGKRGRSQSKKPSPEEFEQEGDSDEGLDNEVNPVGMVLDFVTKKEVMRRIAFPKIRVNPVPVKDAGFMYQKAFGEDRFIAAGYVHIDVGLNKPGKLSKDNAYVFHVVKGVVEVRIHKNQFIMAKGGMFLVPRGNMYSIENICDKKVELFFAQSRKIRATEEDAELIQASQSQSQASKVADGEEEEEEEEEEVEKAPVKKKVGKKK